MSSDGKSLPKALAAIRSTPVSDKLPSPAVLLQGRNLRVSLPFQQAALQPQLITADFVRANLQQRQSTAAFDHWKTHDARSSALMVGQRVRVYVESQWQLGVVEKVCEEPNSYSIRQLDGRAFRRTSNTINLDQSSSASFGAVLLSAGANKPSCSSDNCTAARKCQSPGTDTNANVICSNRCWDIRCNNGTLIFVSRQWHFSVFSRSSSTSRCSSSDGTASPRSVPCRSNRPTGPMTEQPHGSTRSGKSFLKQ